MTERSKPVQLAVAYVIVARERGTRPRAATGRPPDALPSNDVWSSIDGSRWVDHGAAGWSPRFALASTVFRGRVWVLGGKESGGRFTNDVWYMDDGQGPR